MGKKILVPKLSVNGKPFLSRVSRNNRAQMQFKDKIGDPVGACIRSKEKGKSYTKEEKKQHMIECKDSVGVQSGTSIGVIDPDSYYWRKQDGRVGGGQPV